MTTTQRPTLLHTTGYTTQETQAAEAMLMALGIDKDAADGAQYEEFFRHAATMAKCLSLLWAKRGYGQSWRKTGYLGSTLKISMKTERLMNLLWWRQPEDVPTETSEDASDTFLDLANYAIFGYEQWKAGEERGPVEEHV